MDGLEQEGNTEFNTWNLQNAKAFLKQIAPNEYTALNLEKVGSLGTIAGYDSYYFCRQENGIPVLYNRIEIIYNTALKQVIMYDKTWDNVSFTEAKNLISQEETIENLELELVYMRVSEDKYALVYIYEDSVVLFDAHTGQRRPAMKSQVSIS